MAGEVGAGNIVAGSIRDVHLHSAADIALTKLVQRPLAAFPQNLFDARVWDTLEQRLPGPGNVEAGILAVSYYWDPNSADDTFFVAVGRAWRVLGIIARVEVAGTDAGAVTLAVKKAASGTDIASGTALHSSTADLKGTVDTNQTLTLSATSSDLDIAIGTAIGVDLTGTMTAARGVVTVLLAPAPGADDLQVYTGTFGTHVPSLRSRDVKAAGAQTLRARLIIALPDNYDAAESIQLRCLAGMNTTVADTTATIDLEAYELQSDGTLSSDLVETSAQSINSLTLANKDFNITATNLVAGDRLDVRVTMAIYDAAGVTAVIGVLQDLILRCDVRP
jgi:hypothetical protein